MKTVVSGINNKNLLRAVEQRMINYIRTKSPKVGNKRNAMSPKKYQKYANEVDELLDGVEWQKFLDDFFGF